MAELTVAAGPGASRRRRSSVQQLQLARLGVALLAGRLLPREAPRGAGAKLRPPHLHHLALDVGHLAADLGHLSLEADQDPRVWSRAAHCLRPALAILPGVRLCCRRRERKDLFFFDCNKTEFKSTSTEQTRDRNGSEASVR